MQKHRRRDYRKYLKSPEWAAKRIQIIVRDNRQCQHCRVGGKYLQVHHKTYDRFGAELLTDLITLCPTCHQAEHRKTNLPLEANYG